MIEIKRHGSYLELDENGFVIPVVKLDLIQTKWQPIINIICDYYKSVCGDNLISIYIRGSVAKGDAVDEVSDIDSFAIIENPMDLDWDENENLDKKIRFHFPFCNGIELWTATRESISNTSEQRKRSILSELIKTQSVCVWGEDLASTIDPFRLEDMKGHSYFLEKDLESLKEELQKKDVDSTYFEDFCSWIAKRIIRSGFDLVMLREKKFTRDLYLCYESFAKYYLNQEPRMRIVLDMALNPLSNPEQIEKQIKEICTWLVNEINSSSNK